MEMPFTSKKVKNRTSEKPKAFQVAAEEIKMPEPEPSAIKEGLKVSHNIFGNGFIHTVKSDTALVCNFGGTLRLVSIADIDITYV